MHPPAAQRSAAGAHCCNPQAIASLPNLTRIHCGHAVDSFDSLVYGSLALDANLGLGLTQRIAARDTVKVSHHWAHATYGLWDSPFETALIISADGRGDDGVCNVYMGDKRRSPALQLLKKTTKGIGGIFGIVAFVPEVCAGRPGPASQCCSLRPLCEVGPLGVGGGSGKGVPCGSESPVL